MCLDQTGEIQNFGNLGIVQQNIRMAEVQEDKDQGSVGGDGVMGEVGRATPGAAGLCSYTQKPDIFFFPLHSNPVSSPGVILTWNSLPKSPWAVPDALASFK